MSRHGHQKRSIATAEVHFQRSVIATKFVTFQPPEIIRRNEFSQHRWPG
jgi:hypothetical protein